MKIAAYQRPKNSKNVYFRQPATGKTHDVTSKNVYFRHQTTEINT